MVTQNNNKIVKEDSKPYYYYYYRLISIKMKENINNTKHLKIKINNKFKQHYNYYKNNKDYIIDITFVTKNINNDIKWDDVLYLCIN